MPFVPIPNVCKFDFVQTWQGQQIMNSLYIQSATAWTVNTVQDQIIALDTWAKAHLLIDASNTLSLNKIIATDLTSQTGISIENAVAGGNSGAEAQTSVPNNVALCVKFVTGTRGRSYRGRWYLAGILASRVVDNRVTLSFAQSVADHFNALKSGAILEGNTWVVASRITNGAPRTTGIATPVTGVSCEILIDSQRRRLPGRGS